MPQTTIIKNILYSKQGLIITQIQSYDIIPLKMNIPATTDLIPCTPLISQNGATVEVFVDTVSQGNITLLPNKVYSLKEYTEYKVISGEVSNAFHYLVMFNQTRQNNRTLSTDTNGYTRPIRVSKMKQYWDENYTNVLVDTDGNIITDSDGMMFRIS